eukprot:6546455-Prymnesium_polylepis.1
MPATDCTAETNPRTAQSNDHRVRVDKVLTSPVAGLKAVRTRTFTTSHNAGTQSSRHSRGTR